MPLALEVIARRQRACSASRRTDLCLLAALVIALVVPGAARAGATPDPARMAELREAVARAPVLLARGDFGLREFHHPWIDSSGVSGRKDPDWRPRPALIASADAPRPEAPPIIPWSRITSLETQRQKKLQGAVAGFVAGLAIGGTLALTYEAKNSEDWTGVGLLVGTPTCGLLLGTIIGSLSGTSVIYRATTQGSN